MRTASPGAEIRYRRHSVLPWAIAGLLLLVVFVVIIATMLMAIAPPTGGRR